MILLTSAEADCFRGRPGDIERAEHPVPQRQVDTEVLVEMPRRIAVVNLMLRGTAQHPLDQRPE
ncbi:hypothetical protein D3C86_2160270 [compost metagenome]